MIAGLILGTLALGSLILVIDDDDGESVALNTDATEGADDLQFGAGDDSIELGAGFDTIRAGSGDDSIDAGAGQDVVYAEDGNDSVSGGGFHDIVFGGAGDDTLAGDAGLDVLYGGAGDDLLLGGAWNDTLIGDDGADSLSGGEGNDALSGLSFSRDATVEEIVQFRNDETTGTQEDFHLTLEADGADTLDGGAGDDFLQLGRGDTGIGGEGKDEFELHPNQDGDGVIVIEDYTFGQDGVQIILEDENGEEITPVRSDYTVERDDDTGDALILERGQVIARLVGAGDTFSNDYLMVGRYV